MIDKVPGPRIGNDINPYLVALLAAVRDGYIPPSTVTKDEYYQIKRSPDDYPPELVGFVGFCCSFGSKWWGGYAANKKGTNYAAVGSRNLCKQAPRLCGAEFTCDSYLDMAIPPKSLIYCDPPYAGTTKYIATFDYDVFWAWCEHKHHEGHTVFVSERSAPGCFECIKEVVIVSTLQRNRKDAMVERLFRYKG